MTQILKIIERETFLFILTMILVVLAGSNALIQYKLAVKSSKSFRTSMINMVTVIALIFIFDLM